MFYLQSYQDLKSIDHVCINPNTKVIYRFTLAQVEYRLMFYFTIVNKTLRHRNSWLARQ